MNDTATNGLDRLNARLERLAVELEAARKVLEDWDTAHEVGPTDPGLHSFNKHLTARQVNKRVDGFVNAMKRESIARDRLKTDVGRVTGRIHDTKQEIRNLNAAHTLVDLPNARAVRDKEGWHPVTRNNKTTVTVPRGYGLDDKRIPHALILEVLS